MIKRIIFDLDCTLLTGDFSDEQNLFKKVFKPEEVGVIKQELLKVLDSYEKEYDRYDVKIMAKYISNKLNVDFNEDIINEWIINNSNCVDKMSPNVIEILEYLKNKGYSLGILTNWFKGTQEPRLKRCNILHYFDSIIYGEEGIKPYKNSYLKACNGFKEDECIIIGDDIKYDVLEPLKYGIDAIWFNPTYKQNKENVKEVNDLIELKKFL